jgi:hypothetical protein
MALSDPDSIHFDPLPPAGEKWRSFERKAIKLRKFAGLDQSRPLDPYQLAELIRIKVVSLKDLKDLSEESRLHLSGSDNWSGGVTELLPDGTRIVIINDRHSRRRNAVTLMEEICHSILGHKPSIISQTNGRTYDRQIEEEAYSVGAAALVPYQALAEKLAKHETVKSIAGFFGVSVHLIEYRMRVLGLWKYDI